MESRTLQQFCFAVLLTLLIASAVGVVSAQTGRIIVTTDVEMIGVTSLGGGGHIYFTAVGGEARDLREKILYHYDDGNGIIEADEALSYSLDVQNYLERPPSGTLGTEYRYGRMKTLSLDEGNSNAGVEESTTGLVGTDMTTIGSLSMVLRFTMETSEAKRTYAQDETTIVRAFYDVFSVRSETDFETNYGPFPYFPWPLVSGALYAGNDSRGLYDDNARMVMDSGLLRLNTSKECYLKFNYTGTVADADDYLVFMTSEDGVNWYEIHNLTTSNNTSTWAPVFVNLTDELAGKEFYLRLLFKSGPSGNSTGFMIDDLGVYGPSFYDGQIEMHHTDYLLGTISFQDIDSERGAVHLVRTPGGMILSYTSNFEYADSGRDSTVFVAFDLFENPQLLFVLMFILTYVLLSVQNKFYMSFKMAHPRRYRAGAVRMRWLHILAKVVVLLYIIFYFFPSLFVFLGPRVYLTGLFMWIFMIGSFIAIVVTSKLLYDRKTMIIPPAAEEEEDFRVASQAPVVVAAAPPPPPVHSTLACSVCMDEITDLRKAIRCRCGQLYHKSCAAKVATCPSCGNDLELGEEEEKAMTTAKCSSCSEIVLVEEGMDLMKTICENCGSTLKVVELGYNHLMIDESPTSAYEQFNSLVKRNIPGLVISTTYPEKLKREISVENVELYWLTDTSSEYKTLDPKRLDFEIMRAISNFVKKAEGGTILLDGVEYLAVENGFDVALKFMKKVNDLCSINDATLIVPITPLSLSPDQLSMVKKEFDRVEVLVERKPEGAA
ncbi:MAG: DUF835 domain-containing protein [Thermoplasmata archaeon]